MGVDPGRARLQLRARVFVSVEKKKRRKEEEEEEEEAESISTVLLPFLMEQALTSALLNGPLRGTSPPVKDSDCAPQAPTCWILRK